MKVDRTLPASENGLVRRWLLLAIGLSALLWAGSTRTASVPPEDIVATAAVASCLLTDNSQGPDDSDQQWRAQRHTIAAVTEPMWKSALAHAELAATSSARPLDPGRAASSPDPPVRSALPHLRHTPLLI